MKPPVELVAVDGAIASSYNKSGGTGGPRANLTALAKLGKAGIAVPEAAAALKALSDAVLKAGGDFRVTEMHRDVAVQQAARAKYDAWVDAGKPSTSSEKWNAKTMKAAFVAAPGRSCHNAGRAIDVHLGVLAFPGVPADKQLDKLWEIARPLGWEPIIKQADEGASEAWHFDYWGELKGVKDRLGYEQAARVGAILVGHGDLSTYEAILQALLSRAGYALGPVDGIVGPRTIACVASALKCTDVEAKAKVAAKDSALLATILALPAK